jgi:hypothetical protein
MTGKRLGTEFLYHIKPVDTMVYIDQAMLMLSDMVFLELGEHKYETIRKHMPHIEFAEEMDEPLKKEFVPKATIARYYRLLGIAELGLDHLVKAAKAFFKSYKMAPIPEMKQGYEAVHGWKNLSTNARKSKLDSLLAGLPTKPLSFPNFQSWLGPQVKSEKWVIRELGYKGPIPYEFKIEGVLGVYRFMEEMSRQMRSTGGPCPMQ